MTLNNSHKVNGNEMLICCTNAQINFFYLSSQPTKKYMKKFVGQQRIIGKANMIIKLVACAICT